MQGGDLILRMDPFCSSNVPELGRGEYFNKSFALLITRPDGSPSVDGTGRCSPVVFDPTSKYAAPEMSDFRNVLLDAVQKFDLESRVQKAMDGGVWSKNIFPEDMLDFMLSQTTKLLEKHNLSTDTFSAPPNGGIGGSFTSLQ